MDAYPATVLLVEDNPADARLIRELLREAEPGRWTVEVVDRVATAIARLAVGGIDVVLLDLSLPDVQGFATFTTAHAAAPGVPIVVLTGLSDEALAIRAVHEGAQDYLVKADASPQVLTRAMRYAIERARAEAERIELLRRERAARAEAEAERARLQAILQSAAHAIIFVERETGYVTPNEAASRLLGMEIRSHRGAGQYLGRIFWPGGEPLTADQLLASRAMAGEAIDNVELLVRRPDGRQIPVLGGASPVRGPGGETTGAVVIFQDITRLKELERQREEWTSVVAHDLRQPVGAISVYAAALSILAKQGVSLADALPRIEHIAAAAEQIDRMIGDLLDVSRLGADRLKLELTSIDPALLIRQAVQRFNEGIGEHRLDLSVAGDVPRVRADAARLEQVLSNLLTNAVKYGTPATPIHVSVAARGDNVCCSVSNAGQGIPASDRERVFSRFYRSEAARAGSTPGLGLGLYVSHEIVRALGGRMWVDSTPGETTTFSFTLPVFKE